MCCNSHPVLHRLTVGPLHFCSGSSLVSLYTMLARLRSQIFTRNTDICVHYSVSTSQLTTKLLTYKIYGTLNQRPSINRCLYIYIIQNTDQPTPEPLTYERLMVSHHNQPSPRDLTRDTLHDPGGGGQISGSLVDKNTKLINIKCYTAICEHHTPPY